jgi:5-formyltetrahydrofolate cyclo-ligase
VTPEGDRVGKGEGFAELEFAVLCALNRVQRRQPLDRICTATRTIRVARRPRRPDGVRWDALPAQRRQEMPILAELYRRSLASG